jgi:omega-6 fatty acid desaturase (delta-12 desaturase)
MKNNAIMTVKQTTGPQLPWRDVVTGYNKPDRWRSAWQIVNSLVPYLVLWFLMIVSLKISFWIVLPLSMVAAGFLIRLFIIFHDCGHGSFFKSRKSNFIVGNIFSIMAFTPYMRWTDSHRIHHQTVGNLDKRGIGDVWTLTVSEYLNLSRSGRLKYRIFRHPVIFLGLGAFLMFMVFNRFTTRRMNRTQKLNLYFTNALIALIAVSMSLLVGWKAYLVIQLPVMYFAAVGGVYLFYLQHQYEEVYWCRQKEWDYRTMAMEGSSFFKLPLILQWFTGNIGFHHVHHLGPTIPNYLLAKCHRENAIFHGIHPITLWASLRALRIRLWDEEQKRAVGFREVRFRGASQAG